jgi:hypothetical protein
MMEPDNESSNLSLDLIVAQVTTANRVLVSSGMDRTRFCRACMIVLAFPGFVGTNTPIIVHVLFFFVVVFFFFLLFFFFVVLLLLLLLSLFFCYGLSGCVFPAAGVSRQSSSYKLMVSAARRNTASVEGNCGTSSLEREADLLNC